jgi:hypothetical protein
MPEPTMEDLARRIEAIERRLGIRDPSPAKQPLPRKSSSTYEHLVGLGKDLWESDEELDAFLEAIRESRRAGG